MIPSTADLAADILGRAEGRARFIVAIAGPPGAGKSTVSDALAAFIEDAAPSQSALVPMDGYHLDNAVLAARGMLHRKGAPQTFDVAGLASALQRIRSGDEPVFVPVFDRSRDLARAGARAILPEQRIVLVEGNYLLVEDRPWSDLATAFDLAVWIDVDPAELRRRLLERWRQHGLTPDEAAERAEGNDMVNAEYARARSRKADIVCR